jgi:hypothetical protein
MTKFKNATRLAKATALRTVFGFAAPLLYRRINVEGMAWL